MHQILAILLYHFINAKYIVKFTYIIQIVFDTFYHIVCMIGRTKNVAAAGIECREITEAQAPDLSTLHWQQHSASLCPLQYTVKYNGDLWIFD